MLRIFSRAIVPCLVLALSGYSLADSGEKDPFEGYNRAVTQFNLQVDDAVLVPVAKGYKKAVPELFRIGIGNFLSNLKEPFTMVNNLLQGKPREAGQDFGRFLVNTTLGFAGLADVATELGMERNNEDFGQTLAVWGVPSGPHLVLPLLGPANIRDGFGIATGMVYGEPIEFTDSEANLAMDIVGVVDTRTRLLGTEKLIALQPDPYLFLRESYRQRRQVAIHDGDVPENPTLEDQLLDELLQE